MCTDRRHSNSLWLTPEQSNLMYWICDEQNLKCHSWFRVLVCSMWSSMLYVVNSLFSWMFAVRCWSKANFSPSLHHADGPRLTQEKPRVSLPSFYYLELERVSVQRAKDRTWKQLTVMSKPTNNVQQRTLSRVRVSHNLLVTTKTSHKSSYEYLKISFNYSTNYESTSTTQYPIGNDCHLPSSSTLI